MPISTAIRSLRQNSSSWFRRRATASNVPSSKKALFRLVMVPPKNRVGDAVTRKFVPALAAMSMIPRALNSIQQNGRFWDWWKSTVRWSLAGKAHLFRRAGGGLCRWLNCLAMTRIPGLPGVARRAAISQRPCLSLRRDARRHASLAHLYCTFGTAFIWRRYDQILGPRSHVPKFANSVCRNSEILVCLDPHLIRQAAESDMECGSAFRLVSHKGLPYCPISTVDRRKQPSTSLRSGHFFKGAA
jgi:hypothetical protein